MPDGSITKLVIMLVCLAFSAFFSASETAFTSANHTKLKNLSAEGSKRASLVLKMLENYDKLLSTILVGNNIVNITLSSVGTLLFIDLLTDTNWLSAASAISTAVITVVVLIFGEISPKSLAKDKPDRFSMAVAPFLQFISAILTPMNFLFMLWKKLLVLIFKPAEEEAVTEGEVLTLLDEAHEDGSIDEYNKELIENIFDFDDLSAGEIATHRTEMTTLSVDETMEEWDAIIQNSNHSRYPVCGEGIDDIVGILDTRTYFRLADKSRDSVMANAVKPAYFVPEAVKADVLFRNMKKNKESIAIVLDEYGGVRGVITVTDLVQCLVGDFTESDEDGEEIEPIVQLDENRWQISGAVTITELEDALNMEIADCDTDTFSGFVLGLYGSIPDDCATFEISTEQMDIQVTEIREHRVESAVIILKTEDDEEADKPAKSEAALS
ncbi:MAG: HlyC/CorC family transporter [Clostridia bacterium]|nr:HlyC/CorC family transporter [Clostridia bacterium]